MPIEITLSPVKASVLVKLWLSALFFFSVASFVLAVNIYKFHLAAFLVSLAFVLISSFMGWYSLHLKNRAKHSPTKITITGNLVTYLYMNKETVVNLDSVKHILFGFIVSKTVGHEIYLTVDDNINSNPCFINTYEELLPLFISLVKNGNGNTKLYFISDTTLIPAQGPLIKDVRHDIESFFSSAPKGLENK